MNGCVANGSNDAGTILDIVTSGVEDERESWGVDCGADDGVDWRNRAGFCRSQKKTTKCNRRITGKQARVS